MAANRFGQTQRDGDPPDEGGREPRTLTADRPPPGARELTDAPHRPQPRPPARHPLDDLLKPRTLPGEAIADADALPADRRRDALYRRSLAVADLAAAAVALILGVTVLGEDRVTLALVAVLPVVVVVSKVIGLYDRDEHLLRRTTLDEAPALFQVATLYALLMWLGDDLFVEETTKAAVGPALGHTQVLGIWGLLFLSMLGARASVRELVRRVTPPERCLVLGSSGPAEQVDRKFKRARGLNVTVVGRVPLEEGDHEPSGPPVLGDVSTIGGLLREHAVDRVIIAPSTADTEQLLGAIRLVKSLGVKVSVLPRLFEVVGSSVRFDDIEGLMLLGVPRYGLGKSSKILKRGLDVVAGAFGLALIAPLLAAIVLAVKLSSPGPVLFRQFRIGKDSQEFEMVKFRTMYEGADEGKAELEYLNEADGLFKIAEDPRLTSVGRVLRRFSFDELPQLFNVVRGQMSLVGPRPLVPEDDRRVEGLHRRRLDLSPGMTGIWQVLGSARIPLNEMVKIDYLYCANWSLWLDLKILLRTVPYVLGRRGL